MPFTLSHTVAVFPLKKHCPRHLDFLALLLGSMTPDLPYYWHDFILASKSHSLLGSFVLCVPLGLAAYLTIKYFSKQIAEYSFSPFREFLEELGSAKLKPASITISLLIGAWTHNLWDGFTHSKGWFVCRFPILKTPLQDLLPFTLRGTELIPTYSILQHTSTFIGLIIIAFALKRYYRPQRIKKSLPESKVLYLWLAIVVASITVFSIQFLPQLNATLAEPQLLRRYVFFAVVALVRNAVLLFALCVVWKHVLDKMGVNKPLDS